MRRGEALVLRDEEVAELPVLVTETGTVQVLPVVPPDVVGLDADPPDLEGELLDQYRQVRDRFDQAFLGFPEHQRSVLWVLARRLAEAHVSGLVPEVHGSLSRRNAQDKVLVALTREMGQMTRAADHHEVQKTQLVITLLAVVGDAVQDVVESTDLRRDLMMEIRRRCITLFG